MALKTKICAFLSSDCTSLYFTETTGDYNAITNLTGYGAPNPLTTDFTTATLTILLAGSTASETPIDIFGVPSFPTDDSTLVWEVTAASLGLTVFPTGLTRVTYQITNDGSGQPALSYKATTLVLAMCDLSCCVETKKAAIAKDPASCGCADSKTMEMLYLEALLEAACAATDCGDVASVNSTLALLQTKCSASACANC